MLLDNLTAVLISLFPPRHVPYLDTVLNTKLSLLTFMRFSLVTTLVDCSVKCMAKTG